VQSRGDAVETINYAMHVSVYFSQVTLLLLALLAVPWNLLVLSDDGDLGRTWATLVKHMSQELLCQPPRQLDTDDSLTEGQDLAVVGENQSLDRERVMCDRSLLHQHITTFAIKPMMGVTNPDTRDLACADSNPHPRSTDHNRPVCLSLCYSSSSGDSNMWIGRLVGSLIYADINDRLDSRVLFQVGLDDLFVVEPSFVRADSYCPGWG
jgi:hypothetical protein